VAAKLAEAKMNKMIKSLKPLINRDERRDWGIAQTWEMDIFAP
jgi:hypothetical protein